MNKVGVNMVNMELRELWISINDCWSFMNYSWSSIIGLWVINHGAPHSRGFVPVGAPYHSVSIS